MLAWGIVPSNPLCIAALNLNAGVVVNLWGDMTDQLRRWRPISTAPRNTRVELRTSDAFGPYRLGFPCVLTEEGWMNADLEIELDILPTQWRPAIKRQRCLRPTVRPDLSRLFLLPTSPQRDAKSHCLLIRRSHAPLQFPRNYRCLLPLPLSSPARA